MAKRRFAALAAIAAAGSLAVTGLAGAEGNGLADDGVIDSGKDVHGSAHHQHGGTEGHLPASSENVRLVGKMRINQDQEGRVADVGVFGNYAYLGAYYEPSCQKGGVYVFDISNPAQPKQINFIRTSNDSYVGEGVQVIRIDTPEFTGDILAMNNEICDGSRFTNQHANGGLTLVDVSNPKTHRYLAEHAGDDDEGDGTVNEIHSAFMWDAGDKAYAVLVDNEEATDVDILDITNPARPKLIAEYDLNERFPNIVDPTLGPAEAFLHDMVVKQIDGRWVMLLSYWDSGYVSLDVTDPRNPTYIADTDFANPDPLLLERTGSSQVPEGNAHQAEFSRDNDYVVAADEDFDPYAVVARNLTDGTRIAASQGSDTPKLRPGQVIEGETVYVGRACPGDPAVPAGNGSQIAVVERGVCLFTEKVAAVDAAGGYTAILVFNRQGSDGCSSTLGMLVAGDTVTFGVAPRQVGYDLFDVPGYDESACRAGSTSTTLPTSLIGTAGDTVRFESYFDGWGYVHLYRNGTGKLTELDTYAIPQAHDPAFATGAGDLSVHEVAMSAKRNDLAYLAYYSGGFRVARIVDDQLVETGHFIDAGGSNFWGVELWQHQGKEYVLASDRDYGVYIFEYTGPGRAN